MLLEITLLVAAGLGNLAWDVTGRRVSARTRRRERRAKRRVALPLPAAGELATDPFEASEHLVAPEAFVSRTRVILEELDRVVDHFDLVLLRAEAGESLVGDIVYIGAEAPSERGRTLLDEWLTTVDALPQDLRDQLGDLGLPDVAVRGLWQREVERNHWPNVHTSADMLRATALDFERAVVVLAGFLRALSALPTDPYR